MGASVSSARAKRRAPRGKSTRKVDPARLPEGHLDRYDWSKATRGKYARKAAKLSALVRLLEPDVAKYFPDSRSVNEALRGLLHLDAALPRRRARRRRAA